MIGPVDSAVQPGERRAVSPGEHDRLGPVGVQSVHRGARRLFIVTFEEAVFGQVLVAHLEDANRAPFEKCRQIGAVNVGHNRHTDGV